MAQPADSKINPIRELSFSRSILLPLSPSIVSSKQVIAFLKKLVYHKKVKVGNALPIFLYSNNFYANDNQQLTLSDRILNLTQRKNIAVG